MRLVWIIIPLIFLGIIGIQESFALAPSGPPSFVDISMELSNIPNLNEDAYVTMTFEFTKNKKLLEETYPTISETSVYARIGFEDKFIVINSIELLDYEQEKIGNIIYVSTNGTITQDQNFVFSIPVKAIKEGESKIYFSQYYATKHIGAINLVIQKHNSHVNVPTQFNTVFTRDYGPTYEIFYMSDGSKLLSNMSPKQQINNGVSPEQIKCRNDLILIHSFDMGSFQNIPYCVKPETAVTLDERGWIKYRFSPIGGYDVHVASTRITDISGNTIAYANLNQETLIVADLAYAKYKDQFLIYQVEVHNPDRTVDIYKIEDTLKMGQSLSPSISWIPSQTGTHQINSFFWESIDPLRTIGSPFSHTIEVKDESPISEIIDEPYIEPIVADYAQDCTTNGGLWLAEFNECELIKHQLCAEMGGIHDECASACRNDPNYPNVMCTEQCVQVCSLGAMQTLATDGNPPTGLSLPYAIEDLDLEHGASHPMGVYRFSQDKLPHPGIDLQLVDGAEILAIDDGTITMIEQGTSYDGDMQVLLQVRDTPWGVHYEHFIPSEELYVGQKVNRGDIIGTFSGGYTKIPASIHIDLSYFPDGMDGYSGQYVCWADLLNDDDKTALYAAWNEAKVTDEFIMGWSQLQMDGNYIFKGLLNSFEYPDGPQMCYSDVDVREPVS